MQLLMSLIVNEFNTFCNAKLNTAATNLEFSYSLVSITLSKYSFGIKPLIKCHKAYKSGTGVGEGTIMAGIGT